MAEPWLDSLSEDWKSEQASSSPTGSSRSRVDGSIKSQTRIPHLRQSLRQESVTGSYLRPRSTRGLARAQTAPPLAERSPSSLNAHHRQDSQHGPHKRSTLPRRPSSAFSESQASVKHRSVQRAGNVDQENTPEWKRRLAGGDDIAGEGIDLFSPSKLEGIFSEPRSKSSAPQESQASRNRQNPWSFLNLPQETAQLDLPTTFRTSRGINALMEVVHEENEEEEAHVELASSEKPTSRRDSLKGSVRRQVEILEQAQAANSVSNTPNAKRVESSDARYRTVSGQEEIENEDISPVTMSRQNTIRDRAIQSLDVEASELRKKLSGLDIEETRRPSSSSSDRDIQYRPQTDSRQNRSRDDSNLDLTTYSLPEDLSMGTQDFVAHGGYVNQRRGGYEGDSSFQRRGLSSSLPSLKGGSRRPSRVHSGSRGSPSSFDLKHASQEYSRVSTSLPATPLEESVMRHTQSPIKALSSVSPLKLFGNRDTYTNNKLLRVLSQFEEAEPSSVLEQGGGGVPQQEGLQEATFRMSHFGKGELDSFDFNQSIERDEIEEHVEIETPRRIFQTATASPKPYFNKALPTNRPSRLPRLVSVPHDAEQETSEDTHTKRLPNSPQKDRSPKRRRTLLRDELDIPQHVDAIRLEVVAETARLAGTKHKDSRSDSTAAAADPLTLASRSLLRPCLASRRSSISAHKVLEEVKAANDPPMTPGADTDLTEALAAELASFANDAQQAAVDSRKPSLATKDYMEEANKVMQFIRARGKPKTNLPNINEPLDTSELDPDKILDLDIDGESTVESFTRPPSREGVGKMRPTQRQVVIDPRTASHLRKYKDSDDLELVPSTSVTCEKPAVDDTEPTEAALLAASGIDQESSPPNMRILNGEASQRKRKLSPSCMDGPSSAGNQQTLESLTGLTQNSFPTNSSSSGQRGIITSGTVSIPDHVGTMTFDHLRKIWVKKTEHEELRESRARRTRQVTGDEDPFEDIPDLSINEQQEQAMKTGSRKIACTDPKHETGKVNADHPQLSTEEHRSELSALHPKHSYDQNSLRSQLSDHELRMHDGMPSRTPKAAQNRDKQPRVVTISFSSPLVSAIDYPEEPSFSEEDLDGDDDLPLDDSGITANSPLLRRADQWAEEVRNRKSVREEVSRSTERHAQYRAMTLNRRPVSRISEYDEEAENNGELSMVHVNGPAAITPVANLDNSALIPRIDPRNCSIIALTPLSEFSLNQIDNTKHPGKCFVSERLQPSSLRQAHGSLALAEDDLVKAIADAEQSELFWEQERKLNLAGRALTTLHGLKDYCSAIEELDVQGNKVGQLDGAPMTVRTLHAQSNLLSSMTAWGHLQNLQYVDVSNNQLDNLDGFSSLLHLRSLIACDNQINSVEGIFDLDGLLTLDLTGNQLAVVDFEGASISRLRKLMLGNNHITDIQNLQNLPALEELHLEHNEIRDLYMIEGSTMAELRSLHASANMFGVFDLAKFPNLEYLDLNQNSVDQIYNLSQAERLQTLSLQEQSNAPDIVDLVLLTPSECHTINLSSNPVPGGTLALPGLPHHSLRNLELACCGISDLPPQFGDSFPNLRDLNLNFNGLQHIEALQGCMKIKALSVIGNRIKKLRRTCLVLARLGSSLASVDIRDNPVSIGFHAPMPVVKSHSHSGSIVSPETVQKDSKWQELMDETTRLKRGMIELLLRQGCPQLEMLDGLPLKDAQKKLSEAIFDKLTGIGALQKVIMPPAPTPAAPDPGNASIDERKWSTLVNTSHSGLEVG